MSRDVISAIADNRNKDFASEIGSAFVNLQRGKTAEQEGKLRAEIDMREADAIREAAVEKATITKEAEQRLLAAQTGIAAAGGIRVNVGSPLVVKAETRAAIAKEVGFSLKASRIREAALRASAISERKEAKAVRKESRFAAITNITYGSIAFMASKRTAPAGTFQAETGMTQREFGQQFLSEGTNFGGGDFE